MPEETSLTLESTVLETDSEIADSADPTTMIDTLPAETDDAMLRDRNLDLQKMESIMVEFLPLLIQAL